MLDDSQYIQLVVETFYQKAINDFMIGYHFRKIQQGQSAHPLQAELGQFAHHIPRIVQFWKLQLLGSEHADPELKFDLINVHKQLSVRRGEVNRWVILFFETLEELGAHPLKENWKDRVVQFQSIFLIKLFR